MNSDSLEYLLISYPLMNEFFKKRFYIIYIIGFYLHILKLEQRKKINLTFKGNKFKAIPTVLIG